MPFNSDYSIQETLLPTVKQEDPELPGDDIDNRDGSSSRDYIKTLIEKYPSDGHLKFVDSYLKKIGVNRKDGL